MNNDYYNLNEVEDEIALTEPAESGGANQHAGDVKPSDPVAQLPPLPLRAKYPFAPIDPPVKGGESYLLAANQSVDFRIPPEAKAIRIGTGNSNTAVLVATFAGKLHSSVYSEASPNSSNIVFGAGRPLWIEVNNKSSVNIICNTQILVSVSYTW